MTESGDGPAVPKLLPAPEEREQFKRAQEADRREREEERQRFNSITDRRRLIGYLVGLMTVLMMCGLFWFSIWSLHHFLEKAADSDRTERFQWLVTGSHALITITAFYFLYQVLKAAERLVLPHWWTERNPEALTAMLGITDPLSAAGKLVERISQMGATASGVGAKDMPHKTP